MKYKGFKIDLVITKFRRIIPPCHKCIYKQNCWKGESKKRIQCIITIKKIKSINGYLTLLNKFFRCL
jgi:hypothetical protein